MAPRKRKPQAKPRKPAEEPPKRRIIKERKEAAKVLGISPRWFGEWKKLDGFPDCSHGYDIDAIEAWRDENGFKGSDLAEEAKKLKVEITAQKLRIETARADAAERAEQAAKGNILPRDEFETAVAEIIAIARDRFRGLGKEACKLAPKSLHNKLRKSIDQDVDTILCEFENGLHRLLEGRDD